MSKGLPDHVLVENLSEMETHVTEAMKPWNKMISLLYSTEDNDNNRYLGFVRGKAAAAGILMLDVLNELDELMDELLFDEAPEGDKE